jgi:hypothetical protein
MCEPASFVLTKDCVFWSMFTDSHEDIIEEHKLHADGVRGTNILRVEITPPRGNVAADAADWTFRLDQDIMPPWHDREEDENRTRIALIDWISARVVRADAKKLCDGRFFVLPNVNVEKLENGVIDALSGSSTVMDMYGNSTVLSMHDNSTVLSMHDSSTVMEMYDSSTVTDMYDNSTVRDMYDNSTVRDMYDNSTVRDMHDSSTVRQYGGTVAKLTGPHAVVLDSRGPKIICITLESQV